MKCCHCNNQIDDTPQTTMELITKTARRLKECENILTDNNYTENSRLRLESRIAKKEIINFKNEIKEEDSFFTDTPEGNLSFRLWIRKRLIQEIESVEQSSDSQHS